MSRQLAAVIDNGTGYTKMGCAFFNLVISLANISKTDLQAMTRHPLCFQQPLPHVSPPEEHQIGLHPLRNHLSLLQGVDLVGPILLRNEAQKTWISLLEMKLYKQMPGQATG